MTFAAGAWEFRHRFWLFGACFWCSFALSRWDHKVFGVAIAEQFCQLTHRELTEPVLRAVFLAGFVLAVLAALLRTWATAYIRPEVMVDGNLHTHTVVADGPYRFVRNPLYLGTMILAAGYSVMASRTGAVLLVASITLLNFRIILREERELSAAQGESYENFRRAVPRLLPSLWPRVAASHRVPDWSAGLLGEMFFWGLALALLVLAVTLSVRFYFLALGMTFGVYFLCLGLIGRRKQQRA